MIMSFIESDLAAALGIVLAAVAVYELLLIFPMRLRVRRLRRRALSYERALDSMHDSLREFATRLAEDRERGSARLIRLEERIAQLNLRTDARPYEQAIALAEHGAEQTSLSRTLGLTQGEAKLVSLLHGGRSRQSGPKQA
ncbi:MAG: DUF2802 domain-containing protein [Gammaproteobacteria bacterium]|nr:DUF2802 domain-containing protein [Gammaproteobacteria bacterium]MDH3507196.1 DUF2802 domain-containing protein [Gammaproteobacteria bacterium]